MTQDLERQRAQTAVNRVKAHTGKFDPKTKKEFWRFYCGTAHGLPALIRMHGLARALAVEFAASTKGAEDGKKGRLTAIDDIAEGLLTWHSAAKLERFDQFATALGQTRAYDIANMQERTKSVIEALIALDFRSYTVLQREALEILAWLKNLSAPYKPKDSRRRQPRTVEVETTDDASENSIPTASENTSGESKT